MSLSKLLPLLSVIKTSSPKMNYFLIWALFSLSHFHFHWCIHHFLTAFSGGLSRIFLFFKEVLICLIGFLALFENRTKNTQPHHHHQSDTWGRRRNPRKMEISSFPPQKFLRMASHQLYTEFSQLKKNSRGVLAFQGQCWSPALLLPWKNSCHGEKNSIHLPNPKNQVPLEPPHGFVEPQPHILWGSANSW